jgi:hypothetical protein
MLVFMGAFGKCPFTSMPNSCALMRAVTFAEGALNICAKLKPHDYLVPITAVAPSKVSELFYQKPFQNSRKKYIFAARLRSIPKNGAFSRIFNPC